MKSLKIIGICASIIIFSQSVYAQKTEMNHDDHDHSEMEHNQMNHDDHDHPEMDKESTSQMFPLQLVAQQLLQAVNGLVCDFCAQALKKVFQKEEAVKALKVDLDAGEVRIFLKEGQMLSRCSCG